MAHVVRLISALLLLLAASSAFAVIQPTQQTMYGYATEPPQSTPLAACQAHWDKYTNDPNYPQSISGYVDGITCVEEFRNKGDGSLAANGRYTLSPSVVSVCPANSTAGGGGCVCNTGFSEIGNTCQIAGGGVSSQYPDNSAAQFCDLAKKYGNGWGISGVTSSVIPSSGCYVPDPPFDGADAAKGCAVSLSGAGVKIPRDDGKFNYSADSLATGETCTPGAPTPGAPEGDKLKKDPCPNGYPGTVNGTMVCAKNDPTSGIEGIKTTKETASDGAKKEVTESVKCAGGQCVTTTTTTMTTSGGTVSTSTTTKEGTAAATCAETKANPACTSMGLGSSGSGSGGGGGGGGGGGSFTGDCVSGFKADGEDPVINAMALEQYKRNCQFFDTTSAASQQYAQDIQKTGDQTGNLPGSSTQDFSNTLDMTDALGGGACPADQSIDINVGGHSFAFVMAVSRACQGLEWLGIAMVAATAIGCAFIVFKD